MVLLGSTTEKKSLRWENNDKMFIFWRNSLHLIASFPFISFGFGGKARCGKMINRHILVWNAIAFNDTFTVNSRWFIKLNLQPKGLRGQDYGSRLCVNVYACIYVCVCVPSRLDSIHISWLIKVLVAVFTFQEQHCNMQPFSSAICSRCGLSLMWIKKIISRFAII